ncbi:MAG: hypothetical protein J6Y43_03620 [Clostridia bacterium]|nr:hypothetical protein [Clostridia bacterium]
MKNKDNTFAIYATPVIDIIELNSNDTPLLTSSYFDESNDNDFDGSGINFGGEGW